MSGVLDAPAGAFGVAKVSLLAALKSVHPVAGDQSQ